MEIKKTLSPRHKKILYCMLALVMIIGVLLVIMPLFMEKKFDHAIMEKLRYSGEDVLVISPKFTEAAYSEHAFYNYYDGTCGKECLSAPLADGRSDRWGSYNLYTIRTLASLGYPIMDDSRVHQALMINPGFLDQYQTLILLHSEYVTKELYQAITNHKHVIYLSPNALYAEITYKYSPIDHNADTITLVRGHNYPTPDIRNGFGWKHDNSPEEYDTDCIMWKFRQIDNGYQLNCAQEIYSRTSPDILLKMKELITP